ncbi:MAG: phage Gp37/Gp68 family protein [Ruminococcus flavefaciens]|nr:phage Gp37/Gp68 family protein [Ruminococcus flavefaciens]
MEKTRIDWAESSWNPVTGCFHECEYCYARSIAERFGGKQKYANIFDLEEAVRGEDGKAKAYPHSFSPTFHRYRLNDYIGKKGRNIFVCSMADLFGEWVPDEWIKAVFDKCQAAPQHNYLFLTKNPKRYIELAKKGLLPSDDNFWYGSSVTGPHDLYTWFSKEYHWFLSVEPLLDDLGEMNSDAQKPEWIIVGAETGCRRGKVVPAPEWIERIRFQCAKYDIPLFMKSSLAGIYPVPLIQEFPEKLNRKGE